MDGKMSVEERRQYLRRMRTRYKHADREQQKRLLTEMESYTGLHRKSLIRLLNGDLERRPRNKQRGKTYGLEVDQVLGVIAESVDYICAERLTPNLPWLAEHLAAHGELELREGVLEQLRHISVSTVGRHLDRMGQDKPRLRRAPPRGRGAGRDVPMKRIAWDETEPGHFETDLVHHCGAVASGEYVHTLQMIDVATGWSERRAILGRSYLVMEDAFRYTLKRLPFPVLEVHPDNGSEFFNHHLLRFWGQYAPSVQLSRSRPYHKNDNRFVEQRNDTLVRAYLGYERLDTVAHTLALNQLFDRMWLYYNFFQPVMHLSEKTILRLEGQPARIQRRYDQASTPFDRLSASTALHPEHRDQLNALRDRTNPRRLRQEIYDAIDHLFALPLAIPGKTQDVHLTLSKAINAQQTFLALSFACTPTMDK